MNTENISKSKTILGLAITTSNEKAADTIPAHWGKFMGESIAEKIPSALSDSIYAVYTGFENEGQNNSGDYTFLIGMEVGGNTEIPEGMSTVEVPISQYHIFDVESGKPEKVFEKWMEIWGKTDLNNTYICDFEEYKASGEIAIYVGTAS